MADVVELAHQPDIVIGRVRVLPSRREIVRDDGTREVLEHRVMQVLVALANARGAILTRDELALSCWQGRVVGEDALNRVMSRLRKAAEGIGSGSFRVETITKIGYRLTDGAGADEPPLVPTAAPPVRQAGLTRRNVAIGIALAGTAAAGAAWALRKPGANASPEIAALMQQGWNSLLQCTRESQNQGMALYRRVTALAPDYADGWGALGMAYSCASHYRARPESEALRARARAAAGRALQLDPDNGYARAAIADARPTLGNWRETERTLRAILAEHPDNPQILFCLGALLAEVGRESPALALLDKIRADPAPPSLWYQRILALWSADRLDEADRVIAEAIELYPTQYGLWFARFYIWMYTGRMREAIALGEDRERRPIGIPETEFDSIIEVAKAIETRSTADIERVMTVQLARAHEGNGYAENTIQFASVLGRVDEAFAVAEALYFERGFVIPDIRFTQEQGTYSPPGDRGTMFLFWPSTRAMRADPRFARLAAELGFERYWRDSGTQPDFRRA